MITGKTKIFFIIADPVTHVRTPEVFNTLFKQNNIDAVLIPLHVRSEGIDLLIAGLKEMKNLGGFFVTVPHKTKMAEFCDELGDAGHKIGSINTVRREKDGKLIGDMFDGLGFVGGLKSQGYDLSGKKTLLLGAGGAARAIAFALAEAATAKLTIANRTIEKAKKIVDRVAEHYPNLLLSTGPPDPEGYDLIINATSIGMKESDLLPIDPLLLTSEMMVAEIIMKPETTALLTAAKERGCSIHYGRYMLDEQVRLMVDFLGIRALL